MANTVIKDGYGQIEPNRCSFLHDGNIESQCKASEPLENGFIVVVDKAAGTVAKATGATFSGLVGLNYTAERIYNQFTPGRKNFRVEKDEYPRVGYLKTGDVFSTNAYLTADAEVPTVGQYLIPTGHGAEPASGLKIKVVEITDTADGQTAVKYQVM